MKVNFSPKTREAIDDAMCLILEGKCKRVDVAPDVKVYEVKNVIRIDLKVSDDNG